MNTKDKVRSVYPFAAVVSYYNPQHIRTHCLIWSKGPGRGIRLASGKTAGDAWKRAWDAIKVVEPGIPYKRFGSAAVVLDTKGNSIFFNA
jgi:hypothetical protein